MPTYFKIDPMRYTPFDRGFAPSDYQYLESNGLVEVRDQKQADLLVTSSEVLLKKSGLLKPHRQFLLWTNEPRFSSNSSGRYKPYPWSRAAQVMSVYTGNVFISPVTYQKNRFTKKPPLKSLPQGFKLKNRKLIALMSYYQGGAHSKLIVDGQNIDLIRMRSEIALKGHELGLLDIYGRGWPKGYSREDSRSGDWGTRKSELMSNYRFNLCFENTVYTDYITEKIWDSIQYNCLPIYFGGGKSTIYSLFEANSFIDYAHFDKPESLFDHITSMSDEEYIGRMNSCIRTYNQLCDKPITFWEEIREQQLNSILEVVRSLAG